MNVITIDDEQWIIYNGWKYRLEGGNIERRWRLFVRGYENDQVIPSYYDKDQYSYIHANSKKSLDRKVRRIIDREIAEMELKQRKHP